MGSDLRRGGAGGALGFLQSVVEGWSSAAGGGEEVGGVVTREHRWLTGLGAHQGIVNMLMLGTVVWVDRRGRWKEKVGTGSKDGKYPTHSWELHPRNAH